MRIKTIIQAVASCVLVFCTVEALARLGDTLHSDLVQFRSSAPPPAWFRYSPVLGWEKRPGFKGKSDDNVDREFDAQGFFNVDAKKAAEPAPNTILFIGDSNTFGYGVPTAASFAEVTERLLPGVKTINLGVIGYTSYQGRKTLEKYLAQLHPAAVVASFNFNDRRGVPAGQEDSPAHFQKVYDSSRNLIGPIDRALQYLYFYRDAGKLMRHAGPPDPHFDPADKFRPRVDELQYRENLTAMADATSRAGIPLVFLLLRDNPLESGYLNRGIEKLGKGEYEAAIEDFTVLVRANGMHADLARVYMARAYRAMGRNTEAAEALRGGERVIFLLGGRPIRLDSDYNAIMRQVAAQYGVDLVDGASVLEQDPYVYIDFVHFDSAGHRKVAELLAPNLAKAMKLGTVAMAGQSRP